MDEYIELSMLILNPNGSLESITKEFNDIYAEMNETVMEMNSLRDEQEDD